MKRIEKWLRDNNITYRLAKWGNPDYFNDGFAVCGLMVTFDFYQGRKRAYNCECYRYGAGWWIRVLTAADAPRLEEHEKRVSDAVEAFWQAEHARIQAMQKAS